MFSVQGLLFVLTVGIWAGGKLGFRFAFKHNYSDGVLKRIAIVTISCLFILLIITVVLFIQKW